MQSQRAVFLFSVIDYANVAMISARYVYRVPTSSFGTDAECSVVVN